MKSKFWTEARVEILKQRHVEGVSFTIIGAELGCSRNAAIGKARRIGLEREHRAHRVHNPASNKRGRRYTRAPWALPGLYANGKKVEAKQRVEMNDLPPEHTPNPVTLIELEPHHCRWPVHAFGEPALFCGADAFPKYSYCEYHCCMAYQTPGARMTKAQFELHQCELRKNHQTGKVAA